MDAGIVDPGNIGARAVPCLEFCASLSPLWRADERTRTAHLLQLRVIGQALQGCCTGLQIPHRPRVPCSLDCPLLQGIACGLGSN